ALALRSLSQNRLIKSEDRQTILSYIEFRNAQGLSVPRQVRYMQTLGKASRLLANTQLKDATKADLIELVTRIENEDTSYETKRTENECIKCFYRWDKGG